VLALALPRRPREEQAAEVEPAAAAAAIADSAALTV